MDERAKRTVAIAARVVEIPLEMPIRTGLGVPAQRSGTALHHRAGRLVHLQALLAIQGKTLEVTPEDPLYPVHELQFSAISANPQDKTPPSPGPSNVCTENAALDAILQCCVRQVLWFESRVHLGGQAVRQVHQFFSLFVCCPASM